MTALLLLLLAPSPPDRALDDRYLAGHWDYDYCGGQCRGSVVIRPDGTFTGFEMSQGGYFRAAEGYMYVEPRYGDFIIAMQLDQSANCCFTFRSTRKRVRSFREFEVWQDFGSYSLNLKFTRYEPK